MGTSTKVLLSVWIQISIVVQVIPFTVSLNICKFNKNDNVICHNFFIFSTLTCEYHLISEDGCPSVGSNFNQVYQGNYIETLVACIDLNGQLISNEKFTFKGWFDFDLELRIQRFKILQGNKKQLNPPN